MARKMPAHLIAPEGVCASCWRLEKSGAKFQCNRCSRLNPNQTTLTRQAISRTVRATGRTVADVEASFGVTAGPTYGV